MDDFSRPVEEQVEEQVEESSNSQPPLILLQHLPDTVAEQELLVVGIVESGSPLEKLVIDGVEIRLGNNSSLRHAVQLIPGANMILITARNASGLTEAVVKVTYEPPEVVGDSPSKSSPESDEINVETEARKILASLLRMIIGLISENESESNQEKEAEQ